MKYIKEEIPKMLFTELVLAYTVDSSFYDEIVRRLKFCGFEENVIKQIISLELEILKTTNKTYDTLLVNKKWWLSNLKKYSINKLLSLSLEQYSLFYENEMSTNALTNSELVCINDEANFVLANSDNFSENIILEASILNDVSSQKGLQYEFNKRIVFIYDYYFDIKYSKEIFDKAMRFFINESHIVFINKYCYKDMGKVKWTPYTREYYNYHSY